VAGLEKAASERETAVTRARSSRYTAVYLRYRTATSPDLQESVALVDTSQDMAAVFRFVIDASRPPTAGPLFASGSGPEGAGRIDPAQERRRRHVRSMALQRFEEYRISQGRASRGTGAATHVTVSQEAQEHQHASD
jgi:hypothetical protein